VPAFTPRHHAGRPYDHRATRLARMLPSPVRRWRTRRAVAGEYRRRGLRLEGLSINTTPGSDVLDELARGRIAMRAAAVALDETGVRFSDGTRVDADALVLATGYTFAFPFLPAGIPATFEGALALYRLVFPPGIGGLAFVGMTRVSGPVFPVAELQARWVAAVRTPPATTRCGSSCCRTSMTSRRVSARDLRSRGIRVCSRRR